MNNQIVPENDLVLIGIALERNIMTEFMESRDMVRDALGPHCVGIAQAKGHRVDRNRDNIVKQFLAHERKPDWLLFLDSDMSFPVDIGMRLISARLPVIGGLYFHRSAHTPLVMTETSDIKDDYGRMARSWKFERELVYDFLHGAGLAMRDAAVAIDGVDDRIHECHAIGTGCMLIHRSVLEAMEPPWFEYRKHAESEDLTFCYRVRHELNLPIHVDLGSVCGHYYNTPMGHAQFRHAFQARGLTGSAYSVQEASFWLESFAGFKDGVQALASYDQSKLSELWESRTARDIDFYKSRAVGKEYLLDLLRWNETPLFASFKQKLVGIEKKRVIVVGSGIGTTAIQLALQGCDVYAFEPNVILRKFAIDRWRWTREKRAHSSFGEIAWSGGLRRGVRMKSSWLNSADAAVVIDVFEHMPLEDLEGAMSYLGAMVKKRGRVLFHNNWKQQDLYPMHHDHSESWERIVEESGFLQLDDFWLVKGIDGLGMKLPTLEYSGSTEGREDV